MPILSPRDREQVQQRLQRDLRGEVTLELFTTTSPLVVPGRECPTCPEALELLQEVVALSPRLHLQVYDFYTQAEEARARGVERIPALVFPHNGHSNLKFYGLPVGYEFITLLEAVVAVSRKAGALQARTRRLLRRLDREAHIQVFVTPG